MLSCLCVILLLGLLALTPDCLVGAPCIAGVYLAPADRSPQQRATLGDVPRFPEHCRVGNGGFSLRDVGAAIRSLELAATAEAADSATPGDSTEVRRARSTAPSGYKMDAADAAAADRSFVAATAATAAPRGGLAGALAGANEVLSCQRIILVRRDYGARRQMQLLQMWHTDDHMTT